MISATGSTRRAALLAQLLERRELGPVLGVDGGEVIARRDLAAAPGVSAAGIVRQSFRERRAIVKLGHFERRQRPVEDLDLVDQAVLEAAVAESLADRELVVPAAGDVLGQLSRGRPRSRPGGRRR